MAFRSTALLSSTLATLVLLSAAQAAPPNLYDQWDARAACDAAKSPSSVGDTCPTGFICGSGISGEGFVQRSISDDQQSVYFQVLISDKVGEPVTILDEDYIPSTTSTPPISKQSTTVSDPGNNTSAATATSRTPSSGPYAYLAHTSRNTLTVIDLGHPSSLEVVAVVDLPAETGPASAIAASPNGAFIYVGHHTASAITVIRAFDGHIVDRIALMEPATGLTFDPNGARLYATHVSGNVTVLDPAGRQVVTVLRLAGAVDELVAHPDGQRLYALARGAGEVWVLEASTGALTKQYKLNAGEGRITLSLDGSTLYVLLSDQSSSKIHALDVASGELRIGPQALPGTAKRLVLSRDGAALFINTAVSGPISCDNGKNGFYVVDAASLLPTLIRDLNASEAVIADGAGANFTLSKTGSVTKWSATHPAPLDALTIAEGVSGYVNLINPPLRAALHAAVTNGANSAGRKSITVTNNGALPVVITKLELVIGDAAAAVAGDALSLIEDRCSGRTLMPAETCQATLALDHGADGDRQAHLSIAAEPASASTAVMIVNDGKAVSIPTSTSVASGSGGGVFSLHLSAMVALLAMVRRWRSS